MPKPAAARTVLARRAQRFTKYLPYLIVLAVILAVVLALVIGSDGSKPKPAPAKSNVQATSCGPYRKDGIVTVNGSDINVETAAGTAELTKGLSGRPCIESNWGMLFDFGRDGQYAIWMKDMKFPIDVVWISSSHQVVAIEIDFKPSTYPERRANQAPARYVLEIAANETKQLGIVLGTQIHFRSA